jgi:hypothetical protein
VKLKKTLPERPEPVRDKVIPRGYIYFTRWISDENKIEKILGLKIFTFGRGRLILSFIAVGLIIYFFFSQVQIQSK